MSEQQSYSLSASHLEEVRETALQERTCPRCKGLGSVELHGQETDCIDCDGWGSILI